MLLYLTYSSQQMRKMRPLGATLYILKSWKYWMVEAGFEIWKSDSMPGFTHLTTILFV